MQKAWSFQDHRARQKLGATRCPWSVGWIDHEGRRRSEQVGTHAQAKTAARRLEGEFAAGTHRPESRKGWEAFRLKYNADIAAGMEPATRRCTFTALAHFERIIRPRKVQAIKTDTIAHYVARRQTERGNKRGSTVSPATINKELRHLKAVLRIAHEWDFLPRMPKIHRLKEYLKVPRYVTPEHFAAIYQAADTAIRPQSDAYSPGDWWRALVTFAYMTGWRISELLKLRWEDVSIDEATAITRPGDNKGRRGERVFLHPVVVDHLRQVFDYGPLVFTWDHAHRTLWEDFHQIQRAGGIDLPCREDHHHTPACHVYGFHDLRRAFATVNAETMTPDALQALMRHKSYQTTQRYINMARQLKRAVDGLQVPECLQKRN